MSYLVQTTRESSTRKHPVLFFCKDASPETSTAAAIVANLIDQLVTQTELESLLSILSKEREKYATSAHCTDFGILWKLFLCMVHEFPSRVIIFVDALDECSEKERSAFMGALVSLPDNACLCVTSRGLPDIERVFKDQEYQGKILKVEMQSQEDIRVFLKESINKNQKLHRYREMVMEKVSHHACGMFRYAALLVGELLHAPCQNISARLESPPADLNEMYEAILLRLDTEPPRDKPRHRTQRKQILQWVTAARRPLKPSELAWSCVVVQDEESFDPENIDIDPQELMELCSPLLEIVDGRVHFTHFSTKEFLLQKPEDLYSRDCNRREQIAFYLVDNLGPHISFAAIGGKQALNPKALGQPSLTIPTSRSHNILLSLCSALFSSVLYGLISTPGLNCSLLLSTPGNTASGIPERPRFRVCTSKISGAQSPGALGTFADTC